MTAAEALCAALGGRWHGAWGSACCPAHDDRNPSLRVSEGDDGRPLLYCNAGCDQQAVIAALQARDLWPGRGEYRPPDPEETRRREAAERRYRARTIRAARTLWRGAGEAAGTVVETYLRGRAIAMPPPLSLRHAPALRHPSGKTFPAMVAAVQDASGRVVGVHRTFLAKDGSGKAPADPPKMMLGPCRGGAVRLALAGRALDVAEGIESALSVRFAIGRPVWAGLSAGGLEALVLPPMPIAEVVTIFADHDISGRGQQAAEIAAARWTAEGRQVRVVLPTEAGADWNDLLRKPKPGTVPGGSSNDAA